MDNAMAARLSEQATELEVEARFNKRKLDEKHRTVFIVVSGDRDMRPAIRLVREKGIEVELWAWSSGLSTEFRRTVTEESLLSIRLLDSIFRLVTFTEYRSTLRHSCRPGD